MVKNWHKTVDCFRHKYGALWCRGFQSARGLVSGLLYAREISEAQIGTGTSGVFIDELPWMDTPKSGFITAFESFWNGWASGQENLMLIVCGSATSWMISNLINSHGGLYGRVTREMQLSPFTLKETKAFFDYKELTFSNYDIVQAYMAVGGIPYYLNYFERGKSIAQNIDNLFFASKAPLKNEFQRLFSSLFINPEKYIAVVKMLSAEHKKILRCRNL